jgi:superfamily II DNA/RNA helicase
MRKPLTDEQKEAKRLYDIEYRKKNKDTTIERIINWQKANPEKVKVYKKTFYDNNLTNVKEKRRKYYKNNLELEKEYNKNYRENNRETITLKQQEWRENNREHIKTYRKNNPLKVNQYLKNRRDTDSLYKLSCNIRSLIRQSFIRVDINKKSKTHEILGCSFEEFKLHLESKFESWMTWENYGLYNGELNYGWDIDHIIPVSTAITEEEVIKLNNYINLQPLCSKTNRHIKKDIS